LINFAPLFPATTLTAIPPYGIAHKNNKNESSLKNLLTSSRSNVINNRQLAHKYPNESIIDLMILFSDLYEKIKKFHIDNQP